MHNITKTDTELSQTRDRQQDLYDQTRQDGDSDIHCCLSAFTPASETEIRNLVRQSPSISTSHVSPERQPGVMLPTLFQIVKIPCHPKMYPTC